MLTDDQVRELRAKHGWAEETIRAIEREVIRAMTCPRCLGDKTRCPMEQPVKVRDLGGGRKQLLDDPFALTRQYQACRPYLEEQAQVPEKAWNELPRRHCQAQGGYRLADTCRAAQRDGVLCPDDSCDIDDGIRPPFPEDAPRSPLPAARSDDRHAG